MKLYYQYKEGARPHIIKVEVIFVEGGRNELDLIWEWCSEQFGVRNGKYNNPRWDNDRSWHSWIFKFRDKKDADWFMLRWS